MWYRELIRKSQKKAQFEKVSAVVELSSTDLINLNKSLKASLKTESDDSTKKWIKSTIALITPTLKKI